MTFVLKKDAPIPDELERITDWASQIGVNVILDYDVAIHIPDIGRDVDDPATKGNGKRVLDAVLTLADHHRLVVEIEHMTDEPELGTYYRSFGFETDGEPGDVTNLYRKPRQPAFPSAYPTVSFYKLFHVGTMNPTDKRADSYEGAGLSVSLHPEDWSFIARLGGNPTWELTRAGHRFLTAHEISHKLKHEIIAWATGLGYVEACDIYRWRYIDEETEEARLCHFLSQQEADDESFDGRDEGEPRNGTVRKIAGHKSTPLLDQITRQSRQAIGTDCVLDLLLPLYADVVLELDGVWWDDRYDPCGYSAPRGVISLSKLPLWTATKIADPQLRLVA